MAAKFVPVTIDLMDEGQFIKEVNAVFRQAQADMIRYVEKHGALAEKAKARVAISIDIIAVNPTDRAFSLKGLVKLTEPTTPASVSLAMGEQDTDGDPCLFVRGSGSSKAPPKQGVLTTQDGRKVNPDTGEVVE